MRIFPLVRSLAHSFSHFPTHWLICPLIGSFARSLAHLPACWLIARLLAHLPPCWLFCLLVCSFVHVVWKQCWALTGKTWCFLGPYMSQLGWRIPEIIAKSSTCYRQTVTANILIVVKVVAFFPVSAHICINTRHFNEKKIAEITYIVVRFREEFENKYRGGT